MILYTRRKILINTDPQRRCYNGCHAKSELVWSQWEVVTYNGNEEKLTFWKELNDYAVSQRGEGARCEYKLEGEDDDRTALRCGGNK